MVAVSFPNLNSNSTSINSTISCKEGGGGGTKSVSGLSLRGSKSVSRFVPGGPNLLGHRALHTSGVVDLLKTNALIM